MHASTVATGSALPLADSFESSDHGDLSVRTWHPKKGAKGRNLGVYAND
jgi:hypothetical protein